MDVQRCPWCLESQDYIRYHDSEWGTPLWEDNKLFALLVLEGAQAGLSWSTILKRRPYYYEAMDNLEPQKIARYSEKIILSLLNNPGIIRNRRKIESAIQNARAFLSLQETNKSFAFWLWNFVDGKPIHNQWRTVSEIPAHSPLSEVISKELKQYGFSFVGPTIVYAYLQSAGLVNDHLITCFRYHQLMDVSK